MPRWAVILLTLILYSASMAVVALVANATVPGLMDRVADAIGAGFALTIMMTLAVAGIAYGVWPRDSAGRLRRPRSPWD